MNQIFIHKITTLLKKGGKFGVTFRQLLSDCGVKPNQKSEFRDCLHYLEEKEIIMDRKFKIYLTECLDLKRGTVSRVMKTFGFVRLDDETDIFVPGRFFIGTMPGDVVLVQEIESRTDSPEGEIVKIVKEGNAQFIGTLKQDDMGYCITPDNLIRYDVRVGGKGISEAKVGDKVICKICERGERHSEHRAEVVATFGDAQTAVNCAEAVLSLNNISMDFSDDVMKEADFLDKRGITAEGMANRLDLRDEIIFTIDSADTKDIDDAISLTKTGTEYNLGVHIADVSHYVQAGSKLDDEAFERGTSIYFADRVVPMLPKGLSNGICSLNENEDRLAFSCLMTVSAEGKLLTHKFKKTIIRSTVKGVYKEINTILSHEETPEIAKKYEKERETLFLMEELSTILTRNKKSRGAPDIETSESYIVLDEKSKAVDILPRTRGESEVMIEEFMLMANESAATVAKANQIPFVYRVHEVPSEEKIEKLHKALEMLGLPCQDVKVGMEAKVLSELVKNAKGKPNFPVINMLVLRSMMKAKYFEIPLGHYGLVLANYAQFTSPIRRYPDLTIHRILSDLVGGMTPGKVCEKYTKFAHASALHSTERELASMKLERDCDDCYKAEYIKQHLGEEYSGIISGVAFHGIYVQLENTVEGLVRGDTLPEGMFEFDEMFEYKNLHGGKSYRIGDSVKIKVIGADVSAGKIDFEFAE